MPKHWRVLVEQEGRRHGHHHGPRRHVHPRLPFLQRQDLAGAAATGWVALAGSECAARAVTVNAWQEFYSRADPPSTHTLLVQSSFHASFAMSENSGSRSSSACRERDGLHAVHTRAADPQCTRPRASPLSPCIKAEARLMCS